MAQMGLPKILFESLFNDSNKECYNFMEESSNS